MKPTPELIYEYRMSRERAEREARERREAACRAYNNAGGGLV